MEEKKFQKKNVPDTFKDGGNLYYFFFVLKIQLFFHLDGVGMGKGFVGTKDLILKSSGRDLSDEVSEELFG